MVVRRNALLGFSLMLAMAGAPTLAQSPLPSPIESVRSKLQLGDFEAAVAAGEQAVEALAEDGQAWMWLARAYGRMAMDSGLFSAPKWAGKSREAYEKAVTVSPTLIEARLELMEFYAVAPGMLGGGMDKAEEQAVVLRQQDRVIGRLADAILAKRNEDFTLAETAYREVISADPKSTRARVGLSMLLQSDERWADSGRVWQDSLVHDGQDPLAHYQLGRLAALTGEGLDAGLEHLQHYLQAKAAATDEANPAGAHWRRGQILEKLGRKTEALVEVQTAVQLNPKLQGARDDLERLQDG